MPLVYKSYAFQLLNDNASTVPLWVLHGLAEFYGTFTVTGDKQGAEIGHVPRYHLQRIATRFMPLRDLFAATLSSPAYASERSVFDAVSWAVVHYLITVRPGGNEALSRFLSRVTAGTAAPQALNEAFGSDVDALDREVRTYVTRSLYKYRRVDFGERLAARKPDRASVMNQGGAMAHLGGLLAARQAIGGLAARADSPDLQQRARRLLVDVAQLENRERQQAAAPGRTVGCSRAVEPGRAGDPSGRAPDDPVPNG